MTALAYTAADTTWIAGAIPLLLGIALCAIAIGIAVQRRRERRQREQYRQWRATRAAMAEPVVHVEATEEYADELRTAGQALPSADLRTTGEQMVADHAELAGISDALDTFSERLMHEVRLFLRDDAEYLRVARWAPSTITDTGTFPVIREPIRAGAR